MITDTGKQIISKYLLGTAPAYASYIALGCGPRPVKNTTTLTNISSASNTITIGDPNYNINAVWIGAVITMVSGTGVLLDNTTITGISSTTTFTVSPTPSTPLSSATIRIQSPSDKDVLDFEMFRVPISSRGYINDNGQNKIILTAELPSEERYEITEVGIYSAGVNTIAVPYDSKTITAFSDTENWQLATPTGTVISATGTVGTITGSGPWTATITGMSSTSGLSVGSQFSATNGTGSIGGGVGTYTVTAIGTGATSITYTANGGSTPVAGTVTNITVSNATLTSPYYTASSLTDTSNNFLSSVTSENAVRTNANNPTFLDATRAARYERSRYLNNIIMLKGNSSTISSVFATSANSKYVQLTGQSVDLTRNSNSDLLKIAFSIVSTNGSTPTIPDTVRLVVEFTNSTGSQSAKMKIEVLNTQYNFSTNRYIAVAKRLDELEYTVPFSWTNVSVIKVYVCALVSGTPSSGSYISLDAIRLDNISTQNPLYGLVGYSVIQNVDTETIVKLPNTNNYIEYRFNLDVT